MSYAWGVLRSGPKGSTLFPGEGTTPPFLLLQMWTASAVTSLLDDLRLAPLAAMAAYGKAVQDTLAPKSFRTHGGPSWPHGFVGSGGNFGIFASRTAPLQT